MASLSPEQDNYPGREMRTLYAQKFRGAQTKTKRNGKAARRRQPASPGSDYAPVNGFKVLFWMGVLLVLLLSLSLRLL